MWNPTDKRAFVSRLRLNWSHFKSKLLFKYTLSYILIFLIPLTGVTASVYESAVRSLRTEIEQSNLNQLNQVQRTLDGRMTELQEIAGRIAYDEHLTSYMVHHDYYGMEAIQTLANYKASSSILQDLFLYFRDDAVVYSYRGLMNLGVAFGSTYQFSEASRQELLREMNTAIQPVMRPAEQVTINARQETMLTLLVPIKPNNPYPYGTVVYLMKESNLTGMMASILNDFSGSSYIFDAQGIKLTGASHGETMDRAGLNRIASLSTGIHSLTLDGKQQSVVAVKSETNGWTYVTTMPSRQFFSRVAHIRSLILVVFCLVGLIGIAAAMLLAKRQYHPIRNLMEFVKLRGNGVPEAADGRNEWDWIRHTIHEYSARADMQQPYVRNQCLLLLLKHGKPEDPEIERLVQGAGLQLAPGRSLCFSVILTWEELPDPASSRAIVAQLAERFREAKFPAWDACAYGVDLSPSERFALMVTMSAEGRQSVQERAELVVGAVLSHLGDELRPQLSLGVGTPYDSLGELNQSFIEAATALQFRLMGEQGRVTYFDRLAQQEQASGDAYWLPKKSMLKLEQSLKQGNEAVAAQTIHGLVDEIRGVKLSVSLLRCICFDLLNALLRTASEYGMTDVMNDLPGFTSFETLEELESRLIELSALICRQVERNTETGQQSLIENIVEYVDSQYADYTLSLEHIALKYSVSTSYLSRSFKDKMGVTFSQYIWRLRMDEVMRQLVATSAPLKEIIERVGYLDAPNFIRKFKNETGYTPGQYRKLNAQVNVPAE
ncbi:helix-turn-helix domain-containing protein [Cohnella sp. JJ-181]|uniref:helix-turn-helix domain-containing protein n=1 Tax=Cohnella rhizoplanae TaxID=2974897 RepID=UPI0022FFB6EB|nr:helix-turn-helix domain-containing protein [Cohnella sp. JJ-181]CAI6079610.1 HTH-type transcriptional activator RhaR [Cohnella sp. JJ-181]